MKKATDTSLEVGRLGRVSTYWSGKKIKSNKGDFVGGRELPDESDIKLEELLKQWHLRAFEFGNWESQNDRWENVRACVSALQDLKKILKTDNIGFDGKIAVAFGARGMGGLTAAHYEPSHNIINMTKPKGDGCFAHELGHAIDYNFGSFIDINKSNASLSGGWKITLDKNNTGGELRFLTNKIVNYIRSTVSYQFANDNDYHSRATEIFARFFEQYIAYRLKKIGVVNLYLARRLELYYKAAKHGYLTEKELSVIIPTADKLVSCLSDFLNNKRTSAGSFPFPELPKRKIAKDKQEKNKFKLWGLSNVAEFNQQDYSDSKTKDYDYIVVKHTFTKEELSNYIMYPKYWLTRGWAWQINFKDRGILYVKRIGDVSDIIERMPDKSFVLFHDKKVKNGVKKEKNGVKKETLEKKRTTLKPTQQTEKRAAATASVSKVKCKISPKDLYPFCANEKTRPAINGVHYNKGYIEATDGHILAKVKIDYPKKNEGKIFDTNGFVIDAKYPTVSMVIPKEYKQWSHIKLSRLLTKQFLENAKKLSDFCKVRRLPDSTMVIIGEEYGGKENIDKLQATGYFPFVKVLRLANKINPDATVYFETSRKAKPIVIDLGSAGIILCMPMFFDSDKMDAGGYVYYNKNIAVPSGDYTDKIQNIAKK